MPKLRVLSDLHLEENAFVYRYAGEDAIALLGDIHTKNRLHLFLATIPAHIPVYFVAGNHEYHHGIFEDVKKYHRKLEDDYNFHFLDNQQTTICGIPAYGGTLFSDWNVDGATNAWFAKLRAPDGIPDFHHMQRIGQYYEIRGWTVNDHAQEFDAFVKGLKAFLRHTDGAPQRLVLSHFMPHPICIHERFKHNALTAYFCSDLEHLMGWVGYWLCGHGHDCFTGTIDDTKIVMNPRGSRLPQPPSASNFNPDHIIEL